MSASRSIMEEPIERIEKTEEASVTGERKCGWRPEQYPRPCLGPSIDSLYRTILGISISGGDGGKGTFIGIVSSDATVDGDEVPDDDSTTSRGVIRVVRAVDASEAEDVEELKTELKEGMCRMRGFICHLTSGALTRTGVRRGRIGDRTRVMEGDFARSSFVTISATGANTGELPSSWLLMWSARFDRRLSAVIVSDTGPVTTLKEVLNTVET